MKRYDFLLLSYLVLLISCNSAENNHQDKKADSILTTTESPNLTSDTAQTTAARAAYSKIIKIDYEKNREILDILPLIPDSTMASWEWKKEERKEMVSSIAAQNQFTDTTENFNTISKVTPNYFETGVVDGVWTASLYKVSENHYILITNDIVGDGNKINAFEVKDRHITSLNLNNVIGANPGKLLLKDNSEKCKSVISEEEMGMFTYDFSDPSLISISSYYLNKKANSDCFKGNEVILKFDKNLKRFKFVKINWRNFKS